MDHSTPRRHGLSRRHALRLGGLGALGAVAAGTVLPASSALAAFDDPAPIPFTVTNTSGLSPMHVSFVGTVGNATQGFLRANGTHAAWGSAPAGIPAAAPDSTAFVLASGETKSLRLPVGFSGRIWYNVGAPVPLKIVRDGAGQAATVQPTPWAKGSADEKLDIDFVEVTYTAGGLFINTTQVDYIGIPARVSLTDPMGVHETGGLKKGGLEQIAASLSELPGFGASVVRDEKGGVRRVLSPTQTLGRDATAGTVMDAYIQRVWDKYAKEDLVIRPDLNVSDVFYTCRVVGGRLKCTTTAHSDVTWFDKPTTANVWGADGALSAHDEPERGERARHDRGTIARSIAADLNRGTLGAGTSSPEKEVAKYYANNSINGGAMNHYSRLLHEQSVDGKAYGFAFDDVMDQESLVASGSPSAAGFTILPR